MRIDAGDARATEGRIGIGRHVRENRILIEADALDAARKLQAQTIVSGAHRKVGRRNEALCAHIAQVGARCGLIGRAAGLQNMERIGMQRLHAGARHLSREVQRTDAQRNRQLGADGLQ